MKFTSTRIHAVTSVLALVLASSPLSAYQESSASIESPASSVGASAIEGSWIFAITRVNDPSASFTAVASFTAGGVFLATGSNDRVNPVSPLYGSWKRVGRNRVLSTTYFFAFDPANPNGPAVSMLKTNQVFQVKNRDELVGVGDLSSCDLQGQNCMNIPAGSIQSHGKRIVPENPTGLEAMLPPE